MAQVIRTNGKVFYRIEPLKDSRWMALVARHPDASIFHTVAWLDALRRTYGYYPIAYTTSPPDTGLRSGLVFCRVASCLTGRRLVSLPFSDHCAPLLDDAADWSSFMSGVDQILRREEVRYLELRPRDAVEGTASLFRSDRTYCFHQVDLRPDLDTLFESLHKDSLQRTIRRAEREGLTCEEGGSEALLNSFWQLFLLTRRRHQAPPPPKQWFRNLMDCLGEAAAMRVAFKGRQPVAAVITLRHKETLVYKYGCSDRQFHNLGGMPLLFWRCIQEAKRDGLSVFDLGRTDCDNTGLITFKDRWGAARSVLTYSRFAAGGDSGCRYRPTTSDWKVRCAKGLVARLPGRMFSSFGSLLYRHMG
jgi:hypothetical protein